MTDKRQQIEDMAKVLCGITKVCKDCKFNGNCLAYNSAEALYNANYRRVPKNAVVLTQEEYEELKNESAAIAKDYQEMGQFYDEKCEELEKLIQEKHKWTEQALKETAKEIYITGKYYYAKHSPMERQLSDFLAHIKETYGVEVEE